MTKILDYVLIGCSVVAILFTCVFAYHVYTSKGIFTNSSATYVASYKDPNTGKDVNPFSLNYYQNYNNNGLEVLEWRVNGYSDQTMSALYGRGYQLVIDKKNGNKLYFCDSYDGVSWQSMHEYDETNEAGQYKNFYYVSINGELKAIRFDGSYTVTTEKIDGWKAFRTFGFMGLNLIFENTNFNIKETKTYYYTIEDLMLKFAGMIKSNSVGTGDFVLPVVDLGDFIHVYEVDENGTVADKPIGADGQINSYFSIDVHFDKRGMSYAEQSMYCSVMGDNEYNTTGIDFDVNYWKSTVTYNITEKDFVSRYSSVDQGYYYALSPELINELKTYKDMEFNIVFDISKFKNVNVLGFDYHALNGLKVSSLTIKSSQQRDFTLLVNSLKDTGLTEIITENVNVVNLSGMEIKLWSGMCV